MSARDQNTEEKIKEAARKLFVQKGYANTKTRDIANEAGINLALLNYYFRSKEKLFKIIMTEKLTMFLSQMSHILNEAIPFEQQVENLVTGYIDMLKEHPDIPLFILSEIRNHPETFLTQTGIPAKVHEIRFFKELMQRTDGRAHPMHFLINLVGMTVFPFIAKPIVKAIAGKNDDEFNALMEERKTLITQWILNMVNQNKDTKHEDQ